MTFPRFSVACLALVVLTTVTRAGAQGEPPVHYRLNFAGAAHHWLEVEATFAGLGSTPLRARMSRSSPGRYGTHEFARHVFSVEAQDSAGRPLPVARPDPDEWLVAGHDGTVRLVYRVFGDQADGTYMAVDTTHAHLNMPATLMWAVGLEMRPIHVAFVPPEGSRWTVATQLFGTASPFEFTAPNLQYLMDSPTELAELVMDTIQVSARGGRPADVRLAVHGSASQAEVGELARLVARVVGEQVKVFGELPEFEPGHYTFLLDLVEWAGIDGMEHRNSTSISMPGVSLGSASGRRFVLSTISHEFFHVWNVERIRPDDLEPFDFTRANVSCCLWLAEGFTEYYGKLVLVRAGLSDEVPVAAVSTVANHSGRLVRSAVGMSQHAPFADGPAAADASDRARSYISYYTYGEALALALDLSIRARTKNQRSLDDFMRTLWQTHGRVPDPRPGYVNRPYVMADLRGALGEVAGDRAFADEFFDRYIEGRELPDYSALLAPAGYLVQPYAAGRGWIGDVPVTADAAGLRVGVGRGGPSLVPFGTPLYDARVDLGDVIRDIDGRPATAAAWNGMSDRTPGERVPITVVRRDGRVDQITLTVAADSRIIVVPVEAAGGTLTAAQRAFRTSWLGPQ